MYSDETSHALTRSEGMVLGAWVLKWGVVWSLEWDLFETPKSPDDIFCQPLNREFESLGGVVVVWLDKIRDNQSSNYKTCLSQWDCEIELFEWLVLGACIQGWHRESALLILISACLHWDSAYHTIHWHCWWTLRCKPCFRVNGLKRWRVCQGMTQSR